jgi:hypothetical protein
MRTSTALLLIGLAMAPGSVAWGQAPPNVANAGGWVSRFVPAEIFQRMLERPERAPDALFLKVDANAAWAAMETTLKELDVPAGFSDRSAGEMGAVKAKHYKRMGKASLSEYLRCGEGTAGPNADMYVVYVSVVGFVRTMPDGETGLQTMIAGQAVDLPNGRNEVIECTSSGQFESKAAKLLAKKLLSNPS